MDNLIHTHNIDSLIIDFYFTHDFPQLDTNFDFTSGGMDLGSFGGDFGGVGSFTPFDMNMNSFPDFSSSGSIFGSDMYGF